MKKRGVLGAIITVGVIIIIFSGIFTFVYFKTEQNQSQNEILVNNTEKECLSDIECVKVQVGCCPCSSGGEEKCVPASEKGKYEEELEKCGKETFCAQVYNCNIETCSCMGGKCQG